MLKYYMGLPSEEEDFEGLQNVRICFYDKPIYIPKLEREAYGHIESEEPLDQALIAYHSLMQAPKNLLAYQMITTRKEVKREHDRNDSRAVRCYPGGDSIGGRPWKK